MEIWRPSGPAERHLPPQRPAQALPGPEVPGARGPRAPQSHLVVAHCSASSGRSGSQTCRELAPHPVPASQASQCLDQCNLTKEGRRGGRPDADVGQQVARVARTVAQREVCECALLRRGVGRADRGRGSVSGSRPSAPEWARLEWSTPTRRSPGSAPASGPLQPGAEVIPKASRRPLTPPVSAPPLCDALRACCGVSILIAGLTGWTGGSSA